MKTVLIIQGQMKQYRAPLFAKLDGLLRGAGIRLTVAYSSPPPSEAQKEDTCELPAEYGLKVAGYWPRNEKLLYQPLLRRALRSHLVIVEQANRNLLNHFLLPLSRAGLKRVAFWGHGTNGQPRKIGLSEWYRRKTLNWASWWFAYTNGTARYLENQRVPASRITVVQNSVDTRDIREQVSKLTVEDRTVLRSLLNIPATAPVGIFCGMMGRIKELPFLIESSRLIKSRIPDFQLIMVGGGPERQAIQRLTEAENWVHWVGPCFGREKAGLLAISEVLLIPSAVGLAILDAFAAGLPIATTRHPTHGPEIEYLEHDANGLMTDHDPAAYAKEVASLFGRRDFLAKLRAGAKASAEKYSVENMAANFASGIRSCLGLDETSPRALRLQRAS